MKIMKNFIRISTVLIISVLIFTIISCGGADDPINTDSGRGADNATPGENNAAPVNGGNEPENAPEIIYQDDLPEISMNGYVFRMFSRQLDPMTFRGIINPEEITGEMLNDALYERNRRIEERFGMTFTEVVRDNSDAVRNAIRAGSDDYDMVTTRIPAAFQYAHEGLLYSIEVLPHIDLSKPYWDQSLNPSLTIANKRYFAIGATNLVTYDFTDCLLFNKKLFTDLGLDYPYALVEDGKWTFDRFNEMARAAVKDINGDGIFNADDSYGFVGPAKNILSTFVISAGNLSIQKDPDDIPYFAIPGNEKYISAFQKAFDIIYDDNVWFKTNTDENVDQVGMQIFESGRSAFAYSTFFFVTQLRGMEADFGILPFPKLDESQDRYYSRVSFTDLFTVPVTNTNLEYTSIIAEALACESARSILPVYYDVSLRTKISRDDDSQDMLDIIFNNRVIDMGDTIFAAQTRDSVFNVMLQRGDRDLVSRIERMENNVNRELDKIIEAFLAIN